MNSYHSRLQRNFKIAYAREAFRYLYFFLPIWYVFESQYASTATLGLIYAITHLITVGLELPTGALADLLGRKRTLIIGLALEAFSWLFISQSQNVYWLWIGYSINALAVSLISGADTALHYDSLKELGQETNYSRFSANLGLVVRISITISTFLGGFIFRFNHRLPYIAVGICGLVGAAIATGYQEPKIDTEKFNLANYLHQTKLGFKQLFKTAYIRDFSIYYISVGGIGWYFVYFLNQVFATDLGFNEIDRSWIFGFIYLISGLTIIYLARAKWLKRPYVYLGIPLMMIVGLLPGFWYHKNLLAIIGILLVQLPSLARFSLLDQYANLEFDSKYRATAVSALNMLVSVSFAAASIIGGRVILATNTGFLMTALGILLICTSIPSALILIYKHHRQPAPVPI